MNDAEIGIGDTCEVCGHTTRIYRLFQGPQKRYYCKCNHPSNKNIFTKILWFLKGRPAMIMSELEWRNLEQSKK